MPGPLPEYVESLLWCAAGLVLAYIFLPTLLAMLRQTHVTFTLVGGPETLQPTDDDPQYADLFERLRDLGFEPLGSRVETGWFCNGHWVKSFPPGRIFATPARDCFVSLYRLFVGDPWRLAFATAFADGALVQTANQMTDLRIEEKGYLRWACASPDLAEVLRLHRQVAEDFRAAGGRTVAAPGLEGICEVICRQSERYLRNKGLSLGLKHLQQPLVFLALLTFIAGVYLGFTSWTIPAALVLAGVVYAVLLPYSVRSAAGKLRDQDEERGLAYHWAARRQSRNPNPGSTPEAHPTASDAITTPGRPAWDDDRLTRNPRP